MCMIVWIVLWIWLLVGCVVSWCRWLLVVRCLFICCGVKVIGLMLLWRCCDLVLVYGCLDCDVGGE